ncbi:Uncharacterized protein family (UPF0051) [Nocardioides exalbidus]|uniref:Uncharacterized protein family (UPF0051) n=1 Tax=Nocardioides exalbidus TaxID=402596 RepID=A0A1H4NXK5_9ACTN|nr:SufD family Fe-S cluster assembly protein [Nocardioides exalbidus]SEB99372.1 Uncharacterized protein family (UPF0051) [Nocardioides exalbidus]
MTSSQPSEASATAVRNVIERPQPLSTLSEARQRRIAARKTPPKKWVDRYAGVLTEEYKVWQSANPQLSAEELGDATLHSMGGHNRSVYYPEEYGKELGDGAWVFVMKPPNHPQLPQVPKLSLWWARPYVIPDGEWGNRLPYQAQIATADGSLHLWPHEYVVCNDPETFAGMEGSHIHGLGGEALLDVDHLFYLMSRGISRHEATQLLFDRSPSRASPT